MHHREYDEEYSDFRQGEDEYREQVDVVQGTTAAFVVGRDGVGIMLLMGEQHEIQPVSLERS